MYDVIVLGATFAAAGIAQIYGERCLVLERRMHAGYEFFGALQFGTGFDQAVRAEEAQPLQESFAAACGCYYGCDAYIYPYFQKSHTVFGAEVVSVQTCQEGFVCSTHGVNGFVTYKAKKVVDTRSNCRISAAKTFNMLVESQEEPSFSGVITEKAAGDRRYLLRCPVSLSCGFEEARAVAQQVIWRFSQTQRVIMLANEFDYQVREDHPKTEDGIFYLPAKAFANPVLAFEAGVMFGKESLV